MSADTIENSASDLQEEDPVDTSHRGQESKDMSSMNTCLDDEQGSSNMNEKKMTEVRFVV